MVSQRDEKAPPEKRPVSMRKVVANRKNALKSTGPRTPGGKTYSRKNALKHGLSAKTLSNEFMAAFENPEEFQKLVRELRQQYQPVGRAEELEVEQIAQCWWKRRRVRRYENADVLASMGDVESAMQVAINDMLADSKRMHPILHTLYTLLEEGEKEIEANGKMSKKLQEKLFATDPRIQEAWPDIDKISRQILEEQLVAKTGMPLEKLRPCLHQAAEVLAEIHRSQELMAVRKTKGMIQDWARRKLEPFFNGACDLVAMPTKHALDKILRYDASIDRNLGHALDRLERLQQRRKGEPVPPPISVRMTQ